MFLTACLLAWIFGIFLSGYLGPNILVFILPQFLILLPLSHRIVMGPWFDNGEKYKKVIQCFFCVALCWLGAISYSFYETRGYLDAVEFKNSAPSSVSGVIVSEVSSYDGTNYFYLKEDSGRKLRVTVRTKCSLFPGQHITLEDPTLVPVNVTNKQLQSTKKFLGNGATLTATFPYDANVTVNGIKKPLLYYAKLARTRTAKLFSRVFPSEISGLLTSLISSDKSGLTDELYDNFIATGSIHILVVSGMHFNYLAGAIFFLLGFFLQSRRKKLLLTLPLLLVFALFTGGTLPVIRAFCMTALLFVGDLCYQKRLDSSVTVVTLAGIFLLFSPTLIWNPSFLLSFGATLGITWFYRPVNEKLGWIPSGFLRSYLALQLSVQMFTLPIICYFFARISKISFLTNILLAPLVPIVLMLAMLLPFTVKIPLVSQGVILLTRRISTLFLWCVKTTANLWEPLRISCSEITFLCLLGLGGCLFFMKNAKSRSQRIAFLTAFCLFFITGVGYWILPPDKQQAEITFFGASNTQSASICTEKNRLILYGTMKDIRNARYSANFPEGTPISVLILTNLSDPKLLHEFLATNPVGQVVLPEAYREIWNSPCPVVFCKSNLNTKIDDMKLSIITDGTAFQEVEFCYEETIFSFTSDAGYLLEHWHENPYKYWIYNFKRTGKDARQVATLPIGERLFSKKPWHPDGKQYDNTSLIYIDHVGLSMQGLTE